MGDEFDRNRRYVDSMTQDEIEKEMKPPEKMEPKKPGKIPLSANRSAITEEPATTSSTSQNYKQTPDMNKGEDDVDKSTRARERTKPITQWGRPHTAKLRTANIEPYGKLKKDMEPITKSDEAALKKCITDATTIFKGMTLMLEKGGKDFSTRSSRKFGRDTMMSDAKRSQKEREHKESAKFMGEG